MKIQKFEDIIAWQKGQDFAIEIYGAFAKVKDFGFRNQIERASVSISNNIAEGFDRIRDKDFARFLYTSLGSCSESKSMLYLAERLKYIPSQTAIDCRNKASEICRITTGLIKSLF